MYYKRISLDKQTIDDIHNQLRLMKYEYPFIEIGTNLMSNGIRPHEYYRQKGQGKISRKILDSLHEAGIILSDEVLQILYSGSQT